jgi:hypothetical protein
MSVTVTHRKMHAMTNEPGHYVILSVLPDFQWLFELDAAHLCRCKADTKHDFTLG